MVRAAVPELHAMLPDPFKFGYHPSIVNLYPTFVGNLEQVPLIGSTITVSFVDENNKFQEYGNGQILGFVQSPVDGSPLGEKEQVYNNTVITAIGQMAVDQAACQFLELEGSVPTDNSPDLSNQDNAVGQNNPQTVNSSFQNRESNVQRTTAPQDNTPGTEQQTPTEQNNDTSSTTNLPDCKKATSLREYIDAFQSEVPEDSQDPNAEYPVWPLVYGGFDIKTKKAISPAVLTSGINPKRTITVLKEGKWVKLVRPHKGQDIGAPQSTPVLAALEGKVVAARPNGGLPKTKKNAYVIIRHDGYGGKGSNAIHTCYFHLSNILVKRNDQVSRGTCIALSGGEADSMGSGGTTGPHLHFEVRKNRGGGPKTSLKSIIDPVKFLSTKWKKKG